MCSKTRWNCCWSLQPIRKDIHSLQALRMSRERKLLFNNTAFSNGSGDGPSALVNRNLLHWATVDTHDLVNLASQLSKTTEKNNKRKMNQALNYWIKATQVMSLQLQWTYPWELKIRKGFLTTKNLEFVIVAKNLDSGKKTAINTNGYWENNNLLL